MHPRPPPTPPTAPGDAKTALETAWLATLDCAALAVASDALVPAQRRIIFSVQHYLRSLMHAVDCLAGDIDGSPGSPGSPALLRTRLSLARLHCLQAEAHLDGFRAAVAGARDAANTAAVA